MIDEEDFNMGFGLIDWVLMLAIFILGMAGYILLWEFIFRDLVLGLFQ